MYFKSIYGNGDPVTVVEPVVVVEAGKFFTLMTSSCAFYSPNTSISHSLVSEESVEQKADDAEVTEVPEKKAKTDKAEAKTIETVVKPAEEVTAKMTFRKKPPNHHSEHLKLNSNNTFKKNNRREFNVEKKRKKMINIFKRMSKLT
jgi:hypothetical protein